MDFQAPVVNFPVILPVVIPALFALALLFADLWLPEERKELLGWLALAGIVPALLLTLTQWNRPSTAFISADGTTMVLLDNFAVFLNVIYLLTALLAILISLEYVQRARFGRSEYYALMLFSVSGMMLMGMANDLILVFLALELLSIPLYILSGFDQNSRESEESALKYFLLGAFASGFLVFGIALMYGAVGTTNLAGIVAGFGSSGPLGMAAVAMLLVGFGFKVGAVPFHMWTPDVYEGAPTTVTAFMSVGAKVAGFAALMRLFIGTIGGWGEQWIMAVALLSAITMIVGNVAAVAQQNIKRMLAYSGIAHAGYILMAVAAAARNPQGVSAALFYMFAYLFTNLGAFAIVVAMERQEGKYGLLLDDYKGLAKRHFGLALVLAYFMLSLIGIPLTGGFTGKFYIFRTAVEANLVWLVVIGALTSVVSAYYYMRVVFYSFMYDGPGDVQPLPGALRVALGASLVATVLLGFFPTPWYELARQAVFSVVTAVAGG
jgi:NADH-quinone oxidoreductase subunit N